MYKEKSNQKLVKTTAATLEFNANTALISLHGCWLWSSINEKQLKLDLAYLKNIKTLQVDASKIETMDTIGAYFIAKILQHLKRHQIKVTHFSLPPSEKEFFTQIENKLNEPHKNKVSPESGGIITLIGLDVFTFLSSTFDIIKFFGQFCVNLAGFLISPFKLEWNEVIRTISSAGVKGLWVASLLAFLIGVTLAYEMSPQFVNYGANIYIVNFLGIALLKEVVPLLTAIIVAGRTGASITAEIGVMKVQEEIDAIQTMGISPFRRLVLPKVIGVVIAVPLITAIADIVSMFGGATVANNSLGIGYVLFLQRLQSDVAINNYTCGIIKSLAFAFIIALVGCFCGFKVKGNANSIGEQTTKSVVLGIILVVFIDAIFAIIFKTLGI